MRLLGLVLQGKKRATCPAAAEGLKGAEVGKSMVALDGQNRPRVILKTRQNAAGGSREARATGYLRQMRQR